MLTINEVKNLPIVFIVGKGRSGTSLLQTIMDANSSVITANESPLIVHLRLKYQHVKNWTSEKLTEFIIDLYKDKKFAFLWEVDAVELRKQIDAYPLSELSFSILCKLVYLAVSSPFPKDKITLIVDKNPLYSIFIKELLDIFPDAKFIHIVRDYRDNVISSRKAFKVKNVAILAVRWKRYNVFIDRYKNKYPQHFYTIRYEDLVTAPQEQVAGLCRFLNIPFNDKMLAFYKTTRKIYTDEGTGNELMAGLVQKIHTNLVKPISTEQINKWKKELTNSEIEVIDYITGKYAIRYNYQATTDKKRIAYFFASAKATWIYHVNYYINKFYYLLPFSIRDTSRTLSQKLYDKFGYLNKYNKIGVIYRKEDE